MKVRYRRRARLDIIDLHAYLEERNPRAATEVVARIRLAIDRLGRWPYIGHAGRAAGTYEWVVTGLPYVIVYEVREASSEIDVVAILHGARKRPEE
jgi:plasmid stabilization system protein ParE